MTAETIQWGVLVTLPNGTPDVEIAQSRSDALTILGNLRWSLSEDAVKLVYRTAKISEWTTGQTGSGVVQWGVRETWHDGYVENRPCDDRAKADFSVSVRKPNSTREVISRTVEPGYWWLAKVTA